MAQINREFVMILDDYEHSDKVRLARTHTHTHTLSLSLSLTRARARVSLVRTRDALCARTQTCDTPSAAQCVREVTASTLLLERRHRAARDRDRNTHCYVCTLPLKYGVLATGVHAARYCFYLGAYCCAQCHLNETRVIPGAWGDAFDAIARSLCVTSSHCA
jgi:hypothetical protein